MWARATSSAAVLLLIGVFIRVSAQELEGPSFDCKRAGSIPERIICADTELSRMDRELAALYRVARASASNQKEFREIAVREWRMREEMCKERGCLLQWFEKRKQQLTLGIAAQSASPEKPDRSWYHVETGCRSLREELMETGTTSIPQDVTPQFLEGDIRRNEPGLEAVLTYFSDEQPAVLAVGKRGWRSNLLGTASDYGLVTYTFVMGHEACLARLRGPGTR